MILRIKAFKFDLLHFPKIKIAFPTYVLGIVLLIMTWIIFLDYYDTIKLAAV